ncbi:MAG: glycoside-pentoside-hexuronide (GPH):cation symporter [Oscillospiraceae bacterium]|jgi:sugar (glycoside-pentoside-hexuronide) transporter|nr:glycoside-pentoside-hexuronide (GPH):cation symporter [Oscillospiraceae bacterium]
MRSKTTKLREGGAYGLYFMGQNIFYYLLLTYLLVYFTDIGIPALAVTGITLAVKIWDAVNDPIFGGIVDKAKFKGGKFMPWLRISLLAIPVATIFLFAIPSGIPTWGKVFWAVAGYVLWDTAYTICDVPIFGLVTALTDVQTERASLISVGRVFAMIATLGVYVMVPMARESIGGWLPTAVVLSVAALVFMTPICFMGKERVKPKESEQEIGLVQMLKFIGTNKYLLIYFTAFIISGGLNVASVLHMHVARYNLGNEGLMAVIALLSAVPSIIAGALIPLIVKKVDKFHLFFWGSAISVIFNFIAYFVGYGNIYLLYIFSALRGIPSGMVGVLMFMFTPDCSEYGHFKNGIPASGLAFSMQTFSAKMTAAISTAAAGLSLWAIGFIEGEGAAQVNGFNDKLWAIYLLVPAVGTLLSLPILSRYKLRDKYVQIMVKCNTGEISREEADKQLGGKF